MIDENSLSEFPLEYRIKVLREALFLEYPFSFEDLIDFESRIDFKILSMNHHVNWDIVILEQFKDKWDWEAIKRNPFITAYYNLGLCFPERSNIEPSPCKCELQLDYCNKVRLCYTEYNREQVRIRNRNPLHRRYYHWVRYVIKGKMINSENIDTYLFYDIEILDINDVIKADLEEKLLKLEDLSSEDFQGYSEPEIGGDDVPF